MRTLLLAGFAMLALAPAAALAQQAKQDFTLINRTGYEISHVHVAPTKSDEWGDDVLGQDTLGYGDSVQIQFSRRERICRWDLRVTYSVDDTSAFWRSIDLCSVERITIRYNKNTDTSSATFD